MFSIACCRSRRLLIGLSVVLALFGTTFLGAQGRVSEPPPRRDARMDWWREARFGMFIHFGLYAVPAGEWNGKTDYGEWIRHTAKIPLTVYDEFRSRFNPAGFDALEWVRLAKRAGMRYLVITTKHHDGFALFNTAQGDFSVAATPFRRDIIRDVVAACRREGIRIGFYYSIMDWHHPDYLPRRDWETDRPASGADLNRYVAYMKAQLKELLTNYGPIDVLWFDGQWEDTWSDARGQDLYEYVRSLQPQIVINNRVGKTIGDFGTPEQEIPATGTPGLDWETCMTMNRNWGYNRADKDFKSAEDLVRKLVDIASKGGNFLLNVGPTGEGRFPQESVDRLEAIGKWMDVNAESIRGTTASPFEKLPWGRCTLKRLPGNVTRLYLHVFDWPSDGGLVVGGLTNLPRRAFLLSDPKETELETGRRGDDLVITVPRTAPDAIDSVLVLDVGGRPDVNRVPVIIAESDIFTSTLPVYVKIDRENVTVHYTTDSTPPTEESPQVQGPIMLTTTAVVNVQAFRNGRAVSPLVARTFRKVLPRPAQGIKDAVPGLRFDCVEGDFTQVPDFDRLKPSASGTATGFELSKRTRETAYALRYRGFIRVPKDGVYRFSVTSDDGSRLWIGEALVVTNDGLHGAREESGTVALAAGLHPITVGMFQQSGGVELAVSWSGPGISKQPIPATALFRQE